MRRWVAMLLFVLGFAGTHPALACSCGPTGKFDTSLERRLDQADLVALVRIEAAILRPIPAGAWGADRDGPLFEEPYGMGGTQYGYRVIERMKGADVALPGIWNENRSNCAKRLAVGDFIILIVRRDEEQIWSSDCNDEKLDDLGGVLRIRRERVAAIRSFLADRVPIEPCENYVLPPATHETVCAARREAQWRRYLRESRVVQIPYSPIR